MTHPTQSSLENWRQLIYSTFQSCTCNGEVDVSSEEIVRRFMVLISQAKQQGADEERERVKFCLETFVWDSSLDVFENRTRLNKFVLLTPQKEDKI